MPIATSDTIRSVWNGLKVEVAEKVADSLDEAEEEAKALLTSERTRGEATGTESGFTIISDEESVRYDEIVALGESNAHYKRLRRAEAMLAIVLSLDFLNLRPTDLGGLSRAIGLVEGQRDLMATLELNDIQDKLYRRARATLKRLQRVTDAHDNICWT